MSPPGGTFLININVIVYYMPPILPSCSKLVRRNRLHRDDRLARVSFASRERGRKRKGERGTRAGLALVRCRPGSQSEPQNSLITRSPNRPYIAPVGGTRIASLRRWQLMEYPHSNRASACKGQIDATVRTSERRDDSSARSSLPEETLARQSRANYF